MSSSEWTFIGDPVSLPTLEHPRGTAQQQSSPSKQASTSSAHRSSRTKGLTNIVHYDSIERSVEDENGETVSEVFSVGEAILISAAAAHKHVYSPLLIPSRSIHARQEARKKCRGKNKGPVDARDKIKDELEEGTMVGIIIDIYEDEKEQPMIKVHWLYRPRYAFENWNDGALEKAMEKLDMKISNKELFYASDPDYFALSNISTSHSSPSKSPHHRKSYTSFRRPSKAQDSIPVSLIESKITIGAGTGEGKEECDYVVTRAWNPCPEDDWSWLPDVDWDQVYNIGWRTGQWELSFGELFQPENRDLLRATPLRTSAVGATEERRPTKRKKTKQTTSRAGQSSKSKGKRKALEDVFEEDEPEVSSSDEEDDEKDQDVNMSQEEQESESDSDEGEASSEDEPPPPEESASEVEEEEKFRTPRKRKFAAARLAFMPLSDKRVKLSAAAQKKQQEMLKRRKERLTARQARKASNGNTTLQVRGRTQREDMTPFQHARAILHVGATPDQLPCRDEEFTEIEAYLEDAVDEGTGSCIYIAGVPGTGKTATVRSVVQSLQTRAAEGGIETFKFIEINGMKLTEPNQAFAMLWEFISGERATAKHALSLLESHFQTPSPGRETCVVLVDELDQLVTKKHDVIYNFFNWPNQPHSRLIVVAIANTMDLPERYFSNKIRSRLGSNRINFTPYNHNQLIEILESRLSGLEVFEKTAIMFAAKTVAKITGDARRALDICRRAVENVELENETNKASGKPERKVMLHDVQTVTKAMAMSGPCAWIQQASLHQKILLLGLSCCIKKQGAEQIAFTELMHWHLTFLHQTGIQPIPSQDQLFGMLASLAAMKLVTTENGRLDHFQRVKPDVRDEDLEIVLKQDSKLKNLVSRCL